MLREFNIRTVRDGTSWPLIERGGKLGFSSLLPMLEAAAQRASQFEAWDMMTGMMEPDLGGHPKYLDIMGLNFYHANQWEYPDVRLRWEDHPRDERWVPLHELLAEIHTRYQRPLFLGETSHFGAGRGSWLREIHQEVKTAILKGTSVEGVTIYPIIDHPIGMISITGTTVGCGTLSPMKRADFRGFSMGNMPLCCGKFNRRRSA